MKHLYFLQTLCYMLLCAVGFTACSSDADDVIEENGIGYVSLALNADTGFKTTTKAVTESNYTNLNNYTVQILKNGAVLDDMEWNYANMPTKMIKLTNGAYELKAFYGNPNFTASTEEMYVEGKTTFNINSDQVTASVTCKPVCGKVTVEFDRKMADYFNDYSISFNTTALDESTIVWEKDSTDPIYMKVGNNESISASYSLIDKSGKSANIDKTYSLSPQKHLILKVVPTVSGGNLGITINVDESTNDETVDILVPSEWI